MSRLAVLKELFIPKEFRIPDYQKQADYLKLLSEIQAQLKNDNSEKNSSSPVSTKVLADMATGVWRLKQKLTNTKSGEPLEETRRAYRHLETVWDSLTAYGVEIVDQTNSNYDSGMDLKVLAFEPTSGLSREKIIETIKPTIYYHGQSIQRGEVIVGTP